MKRVAVRSLAVALAFWVGFFAVVAAEALVESFTFDAALEIPHDPYTLDIDTANYILAERIDFQVNGVRLQSTERDVLKRLGKPTKVTPWESHTDLKVFHYEGLEIRLYETNGVRRVDSIEITSPLRSIQGVTIGTSVQDAKSQLGPPIDESPPIEGYPRYFDYLGLGDEYYVQIWHEDGLVTGIIVGYYDC